MQYAKIIQNVTKFEYVQFSKNHILYIYIFIKTAYIYVYIHR